MIEKRERSNASREITHPTPIYQSTCQYSHAWLIMYLQPYCGEKTSFPNLLPSTRAITFFRGCANGTIYDGYINPVYKRTDLKLNSSCVFYFFEGLQDA